MREKAEETLNTAERDQKPDRRENRDACSSCSIPDSYREMPSGLKSIVQPADDAGSSHTHQENGSSPAAINGTGSIRRVK